MQQTGTATNSYFDVTDKHNITENKADNRHKNTSCHRVESAEGKNSAAHPPDWYGQGVSEQQL